MNKNNVFEKFQLTLRENHSMKSALLRVISDLLTAVLILLGLTPTFDTVGHLV